MPKRTFNLVYEASVDVPKEAKEVRLWIPLPAENEHQKVEELLWTGTGEISVREDQRYGNRFLHAERDGRGDGPLKVVITARVERAAYRTDGSHGAPEAADEPGAFLGPDRFVPLGGGIEDEAFRVLEGAGTREEKALLLYEHLTRTMRYDKSGTGWGRGDAVYACGSRAGNCSDIHSLFIALARTGQVPARFKMGFPLPPNRAQGTISGYHCWAEYHVEGLGWVPVDISEAIKHPEKQELFFGGLDENRVEFTTGRDIELGPDPSPPPRNFFIYPVGMIDGETVEDISWSLAFTEVDQGDGEEAGRASHRLAGAPGFGGQTAVISP